MKNKNINVWIEQVACKINEEIQREKDEDRQCQLQDAKEYLRRAYHALDGSPCEDNDTTIETHRLFKSTTTP